MKAFLIIISVIILWSVLSTLVYQVMKDLFEYSDDPRVIFSTIFSPIGILVIFGWRVGLLLDKGLDKFTNYIKNKIK